MAIVKFGKVATVGSSGLTAGKIYFETSTGLIKVAKSTTEVDVFGGNVKDATYSDKILTITKTDGSNITLNFSDVASAFGVMEVFNEIKTTALKSVEGSTTANGSNVTVTLKNTTLDDKARNKTFTIPVATESAQGTTTWAKIKELAKAEAETVAGSVYKVKGTKATIDEVLAVEDATIGDVYNVTAAFTLNSQKYPAGTNVVFVGPGEEGEPDPSAQAQWDALGGTVDLTPYATTSFVNSELAKKANTDHTHTKSQITDFPTNVSEFTNDANYVTETVLSGKGYITKTAADAAYDAKNSASTVKNTVDNYTVNKIKISTNPVLDGSNVNLSGTYATSTSAYAEPAKGESLDVAIGKLAKGVAEAKSSAAAGVQSFGGQTGAITVDTTNSTNGAVKFAMSGKNLTGTVNGLKSAAYTESSAYATAAQGAKADTALQKSSITSGSANGTIAVGGSDVAVKGLGSAAYTDSTAYDTKGSASTAETNAKEYADSLMTWGELE